MSADDEFASSLRERADAAVPSMSLDRAATLQRGRRRVRTRHAWQVASVVAVVGVVAVVAAPALQMSGPTSGRGTAQVGVATRTQTPTGSTQSAAGSADGVPDSASILGSSVVAQAGLLEQEMFDAMDTPYDAGVWDDFSGDLDALVAKADAAGTRHPHAGTVELGYFMFPDRYSQRLTSWIGWDDGERITVTEDRQTHRLRMSFVRRAAAIPDVVLPEHGHGALALVTGPSGRALGGSVLTYEDEDGSRFGLDVAQRAWLVVPTASADLATSTPEIEPTGPSSIATGAAGYTVDVTEAQRTELDSLTARAMSGASTEDRETAAERVEQIWNEVSTTRHATSVVEGDHAVVSAGLVPTQDSPTPAAMFVVGKHAQWDGWIDGCPAIVTAGAAGNGGVAAALTTGEVRVVAVGLTGWAGYGKAFSLERTGSLTLESESRGVLTLRDAHGATHRFDLATMSWV